MWSEDHAQEEDEEAREKQILGPRCRRRIRRRGTINLWERGGDSTNAPWSLKEDKNRNADSIGLVLTGGL